MNEFLGIILRVVAKHSNSILGGNRQTAIAYKKHVYADNHGTSS